MVYKVLHRKQYPSDLTDEQWAIVGPMIPSAKQRAGCEFSRVPTLLPLAIVEAKSSGWVWCRQKNRRHAEAAWRMEGA